MGKRELAREPSGEQGRKKNKKIWVISGTAAAVLLGGYLGLCAWVNGTDRILPNVSVAGLDVSGMTVEEAILRIRRTGVDKETIYTCYVTKNRTLIGLVSVKDLLLAQDDDETVDKIMETNVISVHTHTDQEEVARMFSKYNFLALPVVDTENRMVGIVTFDDAMDVMEDEATEDMEIMGGMTPSDKTYLRSSTFDLFKHRIPWLMLLMVSATFTGLIITHFESALAAQVALTAFIPMLMGFGCSVPAIMGARTMENEKDRRMTILLVPFMSCSAKLPVYGMIAGAFFGPWAGLVIFGLYVLGMLVGILSGILFKRTLFAGEPAPFVLELPPYRLPSFDNIATHVWQKVKGFLVKAGTLILLMSMVLWLLQSFDFSLHMVDDAAQSMLGTLGSWIAPIFAPLGFGFWQAAVALLTGLIAKEMVVSSLSMFYGFALTATSAQVAAAMTGFTPLSALSMLVFILLYVVLVVFNVMGRDYDAAVLVSGTCGFGMGATPNAMANMQVVCEKYAPSIKAYLIIPLVGSLFADFLNSLAITLFINLI